MAEYGLIGESIEKLKINLQSLKGMFSEEEYEEVSKKIEEIEEQGLNLPSRSPIETVEILRQIVDLEMDIFPKETMTDVAKKVKLDALLEKLKYILACTQRGIDTSEILRTTEKYWETIEGNYDDIVQRKISQGIDELKLEATLTKIKSSGTIDMDEIRLDQNYYLIRKKLQEIGADFWLAESIDIKTGGIDEKYMENLVKNPKMWSLLSGVEEKLQDNKERYSSEEIEESSESEARRREIKDVCARYGIDESEVRNILDNSTDNVFIVEVKKLFKPVNYEVVASKDFGVKNSKVVIYNNSRNELKSVKKFYPETIILPDGLESIPDLMCNKNKNLKSIRLPKKVGSIGEYAFSNSSLESIDIPDDVKTIEGYAFYNTPLKFLNLGNGVEEIKHSAFAKCQLETVDIPRSVKVLGGTYRWSLPGECGDDYGYGAFQYNPLKKVILHEGLQEIGKGGFANTQLETLILPYSVSKTKEPIANSYTIIKKASKEEKKDILINSEEKELAQNEPTLEELKRKMAELSKEVQELEQQIKAKEATQMRESSSLEK